MKLFSIGIGIILSCSSVLFAAQPTPATPPQYIVPRYIVPTTPEITELRKQLKELESAELKRQWQIAMQPTTGPTTQPTTQPDLIYVITPDAVNDLVARLRRSLSAKFPESRITVTMVQIMGVTDPSKERCVGIRIDETRKVDGWYAGSTTRIVYFVVREGKWVACQMENDIPVMRDDYIEHIMTWAANDGVDEFPVEKKGKRVRR